MLSYTDSLTAGRQLSLALSELGSSCFLSCVHQVPNVCPALPGPGEDVEKRVCFSHVCTLHTHTHPPVGDLQISWALQSGSRQPNLHPKRLSAPGSARGFPPSGTAL